MSVEPSPHPPERRGHSGSAVLVATGMLLSRIAGFVRVTIFSAIFGVESDVADAFNQAFWVPNFLQNLLGEGVLSASLIPVYARLMKREDQAQADEVARSVLGVLALVTSVVVVAGMIWTPELMSLIAGGFRGEKRALTIRLIRILFPGIALLVMSAWCLAVLNSHGKFFLSYVAPVVWNLAIIVALLVFHGTLPDLAIKLAWAAVIGCGLQFGVQIPTVWRIMAPHWNSRSGQHIPHVQRVLLSAIPIIFTRGVVQVSASIDREFVSFLPTGAATALSAAQQLYLVPVGLFGQAISAAALPSMSMASAADQPELLRHRMQSSQQTIAVLIVPSMFAFLFFGDVMIAMLLQHGRFTAGDTLYVWGVLAGSAVGLMASTIGRLYANAFYALGDTRTPTKFAIVRVILVGLLGYLLAFTIPRLFGIPARWGTAGLTASAGLAGWVEFALLRHALERRVGAVSVSFAYLARVWVAGLAAAAIASGLRWVIPGTPTVLLGLHLFGWKLLLLRGLFILGCYGLLYLAIAQAMGLANFRDLIRQVLTRRRGRASAQAPG